MIENDFNYGNWICFSIMVEKKRNELFKKKKKASSQYFVSYDNVK